MTARVAGANGQPPGGNGGGGGRLRRLGWPVVVLLVAVLAVAGVVRSAQPDHQPSRAETATALAAELRCPTCQGLSVADSHSPLAQSMRTVIAEQLAAGRDPAAIRAYFVDRYGSWVLLAPPAKGLGWLVWIIPLLALLVGLVVMASLITGWRPPAALRWSALGATGVAALVVVLASQHPTGTTSNTASGGAGMTGSTTAAPTPAAATVDLAPLQAAVAGHPEDAAARLALAAAALEADKPDITRAQATAVLASTPKNPDALLLRGLAPDRPGDPVATAALRMFLAVAPANHPGLPLARSIVGTGK